MIASVTTGKPTMSASCNARHWTSRLHTEPMIKCQCHRENEAVAIHPAPLRPPHVEADQKCRRLPRHLNGLEGVQRHDARPDGKRLVADVEHFREQERLAGLRQFDAERTDAGNGRRRVVGAATGTAGLRLDCRRRATALPPPPAPL